MKGFRWVCLIFSLTALREFTFSGAEKDLGPDEELYNYDANNQNPVLVDELHYEEELPKLKRGIMRKFDSLMNWAIKEEQIFELAKTRQQRLKIETEILDE
jgi:hypothetical protein